MFSRSAHMWVIGSDVVLIVFYSALNSPAHSILVTQQPHHQNAVTQLSQRVFVQTHIIARSIIASIAEWSHATLSDLGTSYAVQKRTHASSMLATEFVMFARNQPDGLDGLEHVIRIPIPKRYEKKLLIHTRSSHIVCAVFNTTTTTHTNLLWWPNPGPDRENAVLLLSN